jgi:hypothetical protein
VLGADGKPELDPMRDTYHDTHDLKLIQEEIAVRLRDKEGDAFNILGVKPGPGVTSPEGVTDRIEYGMQVTAEVGKNPAILGSLFASNDHLNPLRHVRPLVPSWDPTAEPLKEVIDLEAYREKYDLKHADNTAIEFSLDDVFATSKIHVDDKGLPLKARFRQLEFDVGHLGMGSANVVQKATGISSFNTEAEQATWLKSVSPQATTQGLPRIHLPGDVRNPELLKNPAFDKHEKVTSSMRKYLFNDKKPAPARQKAHEAFRQMGKLKAKP